MTNVHPIVIAPTSAADQASCLRARSILDTLTYAPATDEALQLTALSTLSLLHELITRNTPDLYEFEWQLICHSLESYLLTACCLPDSIGLTKNQLVLSLEDMFFKDDTICSFELSKKVAGLSDIQIISIRWAAQLHLVAKAKGETYTFPGIEAKVRERE